MRTKHPTILIILDGLGWTANTPLQSYMPFFTSLQKRYPYALLNASGSVVGLPDGFVGNSEVGHLTIGSGRIIQQPISRINQTLDTGTFFTHPLLDKALNTIRTNNKTLHIMGLLSDAGVHGHIRHFIAFAQAAKQHGINNIILHPFLDGRDVAAQSASHYLQELENNQNKAIIGSLHGRFYAMDRGENWERTQQSYTTLTTKNQNVQFSNWQSVLDYYYDRTVNDEYIPPTILNQAAIIKPGDAIIFSNFRPDRARQLAACFINSSSVPFQLKELNLSYIITPTDYGNHLITTVLFAQPKIQHTLKSVLADHQKTIVSIAETEKGAHITYFFDGYREEKFSTESRIIIPSIKTDSFAQYPHMRAQNITDTLLQKLIEHNTDFYLVNYANADMIGHTGNRAAIAQALVCLDQQIEKIYYQVKKSGALLCITADHGNAEARIIQQIDNTERGHTLSQVPCVVIGANDEDFATISGMNQLADIAPYILKKMSLPVPCQMNKKR